MAYNCKVELDGALGKDATIIEKDGKTFVALRVATTDSYKDKDSGEWKNLETLWHDILVFRPYSVAIAKELKKGDIVEISGTLSYRPFKDENGNPKNDVSIIARFINKKEIGQDPEPTDEVISEVVEVARS